MRTREKIVAAIVVWMYLTKDLGGLNDFIAAVLSAYIMYYIGHTIYNIIRWFKGDDVFDFKTTIYNKLKNRKSDITYKKNDVFYWKRLAAIFHMSEEEMIEVLRTHVLEGEYPNVRLKNDEWGYYKKSKNGKTYILYNYKVIKYLKEVLNQ